MAGLLFWLRIWVKFTPQHKTWVPTAALKDQLEQASPMGYPPEEPNISTPTTSITELTPTYSSNILGTTRSGQSATNVLNLLPKALPQMSPLERRGEELQALDHGQREPGRGGAFCSLHKPSYIRFLLEQLLNLLYYTFPSSPIKR